MASAGGSRETTTKTTTTTVNRPLSLTGMIGEPVVVTYVENPERFYCRLKSDDQPFGAMMAAIDRQLQRPLEYDCRLLTIDDLSPGQQLLVYSAIYQQWCRCRIQQIMSTTSESPPVIPQFSLATTDNRVVVRVLVVDYGNVEMVAVANLRYMTDEIAAANNGQPFCFECRLAGIKPANIDTKKWSSRAIRLFEQKSRELPMALSTVEKDNSGVVVVVCDLFSYDRKQSIPSMKEYLVALKEGCYRVGEDFYHKLLPDDYEGADHETNGDFEWHSDNDNEEDDKYKDNKLVF